MLIKNKPVFEHTEKQNLHLNICNFCSKLNTPESLLNLKTDTIWKQENTSFMKPRRWKILHTCLIQSKKWTNRWKTPSRKSWEPRTPWAITDEPQFFEAIHYDIHKIWILITLSAEIIEKCNYHISKDQINYANKNVHKYYNLLVIIVFVYVLFRISDVVFRVLIVIFSIIFADNVINIHIRCMSWWIAPKTYCLSMKKKY